MIALLRILVRALLFWMLFFACHRLVFILLNYNLFQNHVMDFAAVFYHGLRLDFSATAYCVSISWLVMLLYFFWRKEWLLTFFQALNVVIIIVATFICLANSILYTYWRQPIGKRAFDFLADRNFIFASLSGMQILGGTLLFIIALFSALKFWRLLNRNFKVPERKFFLKSSFTILSVFILFYLLRGGLQTIPVNESAAYFSDEIQLNHAAINPCWYGVHNIIQSNALQENPFAYYEPAQASSEFNELFFQKSNAGFGLFKIARPNIVLLLLESMTADVVGALGASVSYTPFLDSLSHESLVYTDCYASGFRTDQALVSVFSGFPATPFHSVIRYDTKLDKLPSLAVSLNNEGYHTSFYYGGDVTFSNMKSYLTHMQFQKIYTQSDVNAPMVNKWGAQDEYTLNYLLNNLNNEAPPFFASLLTISLHEPFDVPYGRPDTLKNSDEKFCNAARYTDKCLHDFFREAAHEPWYANTLFILVADHGHDSPLNRNYFDNNTHRIPLIIFGPAMNDSLCGVRVDKTVAQHDLAYSLIWQLSKKDSAYTFSNNICDTIQDGHAYIMFDDGFTFVNRNCAITYSKSDEKNYSWKSADCDTVEIIRKGKIFQQAVYTNFLNF